MVSKSNNNKDNKPSSESGSWKKLFSTVAIIGFGIFYMVAGREFVDSHKPTEPEASSVTIEKVESGVGVTVLLMDSGDVYTVPVEFGIRAEAGIEAKLTKEENQIQVCIDEHCAIATPM